MTSLLASAQLLSRRLERESPLDTEASRQRLRIIEEQARRMSRLVAQLLDVSRIQFGRLVLEPEEVDLAWLVASSAKAIQATTGWEDMAVHVSEVPVPVCVDPLRIEQVVTNLIDNAIKFSPDRGRIEVEVAAPNAGMACLSVRDYGIGIPLDKRGRIFDRFHEAHASEHRSGLGLGLHISREIVERHRGMISVEFPKDGGTRFMVVLPAGTSQRNGAVA